MENDIWNEISLLNNLHCENINRESISIFQELCKYSVERKWKKKRWNKLLPII